MILIITINDITRSILALPSLSRYFQKPAQKASF